MKLHFDFSNVSTIEFGIGRDNSDKQEFSFVPADAGVQSALLDMAVQTRNEMQDIEITPSRYEPSEKHGSAEHVYLPLDDDLSTHLRQIHDATNLAADSSGLSDPTTVFCYFARYVDARGLRLTALRRATQFKGVLKNRLIRLATDALKIIEDKVFKLDTDFDMLIDSDNIHILRPSGFEFVGQLQTAILAAVPHNVKSIQKDLSFVEFGGITEYASKHPRAARYLASIRAQKEMKDIDKRALKNLCKKTGVDVDDANGKITVKDSNIMGFLEVLDRRRYEIELVKDKPERYRAPSRQKLSNSGN
jgi:hypothetical protein